MSNFMSDLLMQWQMQYIPPLTMGLLCYTVAIIRRAWRRRRASISLASRP